MALYVVQHGKSLTKTEDPEKGLSVDGRRDTERIAGVASGYRVKVSRIVHSGKKRARETAEIMASVLSPTKGLEPRQGMNPLDDVRTFADNLELERNIMLVGHLPFLERLIGLLVCGNPDQTVFKLQNSGILCIDRVPEVKNPVIRWTLMPSIG
ncbi:phosphohistidine phosphatase SixA [uncultured Desulfosarcina sp.]|uniref:phosphohistidine phosphatase SixA n=1 Tax=uncultured Desulfosarcina sp. TaxID=218289 RepID=UPI0029C92757|nr:phosphohistidine phosphatase SixA [uncultured Desulfosarcina sp.]